MTQQRLPSKLENILLMSKRVKMADLYRNQSTRIKIQISNLMMITIRRMIRRTIRRMMVMRTDNTDESMKMRIAMATTS